MSVNLWQVHAQEPITRLCASGLTAAAHRTPSLFRRQLSSAGFTVHHKTNTLSVNERRPQTFRGVYVGSVSARGSALTEILVAIFMRYTFFVSGWLPQKTSSSAMADRPRELGDFKAWVNLSLNFKLNG